jgi:hypothetical protein
VDHSEDVLIQAARSIGVAGNGINRNSFDPDAKTTNPDATIG